MRDEDEILPHSMWAGGRSPVDPITQLSSNRKYTMTNECVSLCVCACVQMVIKLVFGFQVIHSCLFNRPCRSINAIFSAHTLSSCTRLWLPWAALDFHTPTVWEGDIYIYMYIYILSDISLVIYLFNAIRTFADATCEFLWIAVNCCALTHPLIPSGQVIQFDIMIPQVCSQTPTLALTRTVFELLHSTWKKNTGAYPGHASIPALAPSITYTINFKILLFTYKSLASIRPLWTSQTIHPNEMNL